MSDLWREAALVAGKDLRIEMRSRVAFQQIAAFGAIVLLLFAFALDPDRGILPRVAPGLFWVTVLLSALLAISRAFAVEAENGALDGLRLSGLDGAAVFLGKAAAIAVQLVALELVLAIGVFVLYDVRVVGLVALVPAALAATAGIAAAGTVYGALAGGLRLRETLIPLLVLPVVAPVMIGGTRAFEAALAGTTSQAWPWVQLLTVFAAVYVTMGALAFGPLLEES
ncbi:MAG: heme exporter protein [Actinomycetota bacterium]|nr:heme exporter protein [Actinomycetota bacterium]